MSKPEIIDTKITDRWGVQWSPMEIARDYLQNFFDDNPVRDIKIEIQNESVTISAPSEFDYKELIYMGSDKGDGQIGHYGEGFKAATLNALRNHNCKVKMIIVDKELTFFLEDMKIGKRDKKVVMCQLESVGAISGTKLILDNCPDELIEEFRFGMNYFYHEENPLFGELLASTYEKDIFAYKSTDESGYIFYRKLLRARLNIPIVFVCNRKYKSIDMKIEHDRDRKAFNDEVLNKFIKTVCRPLGNTETIVRYLQPWWPKGHKVLSALADSAHYNFRMDFPEDYYARDSTNSRKVDTRELEAIEEEFQKKKYLGCPHYMSRLGMKTALSVLKLRENELREKHQKMYSRVPTLTEEKALSILSSFIKEIDPSLVKTFYDANYTIGDSNEIVGELRGKRTWREQHVYLTKEFFLYDFPKSLSILLHEWGHIYGYDGSRGFTDSMTEFIESVINKRDLVESYQAKWKVISEKISKERRKPGEMPQMYSVIDSLSNDQKSGLLKNIPEDELFKLLEKENLIAA